MMFLTTCAFLILTLAATATALKDGGIYIVGGKDSSVEKYPSIVQIEIRVDGEWNSHCGAIILSEYTLLSAAHCFIHYDDDDDDDDDDDGKVVKVKARNIRIRAGSSESKKGGRIVRVRNYKPHPEYDVGSLNADIALLKLREPLKMSNVTKPACLIPSGLELPDDLAVQVAGWGHTGTGEYPKVLQEATVYTVNHDECIRRHDDYITENTICAGILDVGGKDACEGDSGGPLYADGTVVGIVSWGGACNVTSGKLPGIYTKVSAFTKWIKRYTV